MFDLYTTDFLKGQYVQALAAATDKPITINKTPPHDIILVNSNPFGLI